jgi:hypothetical protein
LKPSGRSQLIEWAAEGDDPIGRFDEARNVVLQLSALPVLA